MHLRNALVWPFYALVLIWAIHALRFLLPGGQAACEIIPRSNEGLRGIVTGPLVHGDWEHLIMNSVPLYTMLALVFFFYKRISIQSVTVIYLLTGIGIWLFARPASHIGASGVIYGLVSFVFWLGIFRRSLKSVVLALLVLMWYGSLFLGIIPTQGNERISWDGHLIGATAGIITAFLYRGYLEKNEKEK